MNDNEKILVGVITQQFQPVTVNDVIAQATKMGYELQIEDVAYCLENLQRRDLASVAYQTKNNKKIKAYAMAKPVFKKIPETAHLKDLLPTLTKSKEAKNFLKLLEGETSGTKKVRELGYREYKTVKVSFETVEPIVGGSLNKPKQLATEIKDKIEQIEKKSKKTTDEESISLAYFNRSADGNIVYTPNQVRQYFLKNLRIAGLGDAAINQIYFSHAQVKPNGHKFYVEQWPILVGGQGRGVKSAEALPAGITIETEFSFPFVGTKIKSAERLKAILEYVASHGIGFSCYAKKFGKAKLVEFAVDKLPWE